MYAMAEQAKANGFLCRSQAVFLLFREPVVIKEPSSKAGYIGGGTIFILSFLHYFYAEKIQTPFGISLLDEEILCLMVLMTFLVMLCYELVFYQRNSVSFHPVHSPLEPVRTPLQLVISSLYRFLAYLLMISVPLFIVQEHYYFQGQQFFLTRLFYDYLFYSYFIFGLPYVYFTLKYKGDYQYDFNDYALLLIISGRALFKRSKTATVLKNRRIKKVYLVFLVNFFFLSLMTSFLGSQYQSFAGSMDHVLSDDFSLLSFHQQYHGVYLLIFHLIFVVDVCLAIIGYTIASRWLNNRTKTVDMSLYGWFVVLLCYPPMNSGFTNQFIAYNNFSTQMMVSADWMFMVLMALILCCYFVYVWSTMALGFKFSNLTNRGVVSQGPYAYLRHPAYASKNLAWWLDNTHVFSNGWAVISLAVWNLIYFQRGMTEEQHLTQDKSYQRYMKKTPYRFIPRLW